jgi:subtilisin family serine protease
MKFRQFALISPIVLLAACQSADPIAPEQAQPAAPVMAASANARIPGRYIVVFKSTTLDVSGVARALAASAGGQMGYLYDGVIKGFSVTLPPFAVAVLARSPFVELVEEDQIMIASAIQRRATWGIDRLDQRNLPLNASYSYTATGSGVNAYIVDTGILPTHTEFQSRASIGYDAITPLDPKADCNGHGTHVAGTVGGKTYGVAKAVRLIGVRVLDCNGSGSTSGVIAGVNWVATHRVKPAVANMSLGGGASTALDNAVKAAIDSGVTFVVAAGNDNLPACWFSPARVPAAITVGATTNTDVKASYSNTGSCVDLFAPGSGITSSWFTSTTSARTISGTSMASPHVAGVAALYLQTRPTSTPSQVRNAIVTNATTVAKLSNSVGSPQKLLFSNY